MHDFNSNNKIPGVYWLKKSVDDLKIKITIKPQASAINLPKYEEFMNIANSADLDKIEPNKADEYLFKWQEKGFSAWELNYYSDINNCITENEIDYHNRLNSTEYKAQKVFTYIHDDYYLPLPMDIKKFSYPKDIFNLHSCLENLGLESRIGRYFVGSSSTNQLFCSEESVTEKPSWIAMHVVFDDSKYSDDSQLLVKQEYILLSLYYNTTDRYLIVTPDINNLEQNPYNSVMEKFSSNFQYGVHIIFDELENDQELVSLLNKLYTKWEKKHKQLVQFTPPPMGKDKFYVNIEIISATDFDGDDIYIEYEIKIPEGMNCEGTLQGSTHISRAVNTDDDTLWTYGHIIELDIEIDEDSEASLQLYLEAISTDWWGRHRTEGYGYLPLPLAPGRCDEVLTCSRPDERDKVEAETRRFFVGGCHLIKDLEVLSKPQVKNADFSYTSTGDIHLRWGIIKQSHTPGLRADVSASTTSSGSALLRGAEAVLREYSQARAKLAAATQDIVCGYG